MSWVTFLAWHRLARRRQIERNNAARRDQHQQDVEASRQRR